MYSRYIPNANGVHERQPVPQRQQASSDRPNTPEKKVETSSAPEHVCEHDNERKASQCHCEANKRLHREKPERQRCAPTCKKGFDIGTLLQRLGRKLDTGDLLILMILILILIDCQEDSMGIWLTIAFFLFL